MNKSDQLKVTHFIWSASFGGIEKVVLDLCQSQFKSDFVSPTLLIGKRSGAFLELLAQIGINYQFAGFRSGKDIRYDLLKSIKKVFMACDIIHIHTFNPLVAFAAKASGKPVIYTIHGNFGFGRKLHFWENLNKKMLGYFLRNHVQRITCNSEFTLQKAIQHYEIDSKKCEVIFNGIPMKIKADRALVDQETLSFIENKFVIGTSSRFAGFKRIDRLISAFHQTIPHAPDAVLMLVGDGILKEQLQEQVSSLGIENKVRFTGYQQSVGSYQQCMDICVFPSENEPFGLVAIETLLLGKPTLIFNDGGGMAQLIEKKFPEYIVSSIDDLSCKMLELYNNPSPEAEIQKRISYAQQYDIESMSKKLKEVYNSVLKK